MGTSLRGFVTYATVSLEAACYWYWGRGVVRVPACTVRAPKGVQRCLVEKDTDETTNMMRILAFSFLLLSFVLALFIFSLFQLFFKPFGFRET